MCTNCPKAHAWLLRFDDDCSYIHIEITAPEKWVDIPDAVTSLGGGGLPAPARDVEVNVISRTGLPVPCIPVRFIRVAVGYPVFLHLSAEATR